MESKQFTLQIYNTLTFLSYITNMLQIELQMVVILLRVKLK